MHLDENLEVIAWQVGDLVHRKRQLHLQKSSLYCSLFNFKPNESGLLPWKLRKRYFSIYIYKYSLYKMLFGSLRTLKRFLFLNFFLHKYDLKH